MTEDEGLIDGEPLPVMVWIHGGAFRIGRYLDIYFYVHTDRVIERGVRGYRKYNTDLMS